MKLVSVARTNTFFQDSSGIMAFDILIQNVM